MPRPRGVKKTINEKIEEKEQLILELSQRLEKEKSELKLLREEQKEKQMNQILCLMKQNNLSVEMVEEILLKHCSIPESNAVEDKNIIEVAS